MTETQRIELLLKLDLDAAELDRATRRLAGELSSLCDVEPPASSQAPPGAKGDAITVGALALAVLPVAVPKLVDFLKHWLDRDANNRGTVTVKATVSGASLELSFPSDAPLDPEKLKQFVEAIRTTPATQSRRVSS